MKHKSGVRASLALIAAAWCWLATGGVGAASATAQDEREVTYIGAGGVKLVGTLLLPAHKQGEKLPAVLIIGGGGMMSRDGNGNI